MISLGMYLVFLGDFMGSTWDLLGFSEIFEF